MSAPIQRNIMMMKREEIAAIRNAIERNHAPVSITNNGRTAVFRIIRGRLHAYELQKGGVSVRHEVWSNDAVEKMMQGNDVSKPDPAQLAKQAIRNKMKEEHPDFDDETLDAQTDIVIEAQRSMLEIVKSGIDPKAAEAMITAALKMSGEERGRLRALASDSGVEM